MNFPLITALTYSLITLILFTLPGSSFPKNDWLNQIGFDKWVHIGLFALLAVAWLWALPRKRLVIAFSLAVYGILVEWLQDRFIANRSFDLGDWLADLAGIALGIIAWAYIKRK